MKELVYLEGSWMNHYVYKRPMNELSIVYIWSEKVQAASLPGSHVQLITVARRKAECSIEKLGGSGDRGRSQEGLSPRPEQNKSGKHA